MFNPCRTVVPLIIGDASRLLRCPHLLEQIRMIALFDPEDIVTAVVMKGFKVRASKVLNFMSINSMCYRL